MILDNAVSAITIRLRALFDHFGLGTYARRVSVLAGSSAVAYAVTLAIAPLLTRIYSPSAFGRLQIYSSMLALVLVLVTLRYDMALVLPEEDQGAANLVAVAFLAIVASTGCMTAVIAASLHFHLPLNLDKQLGAYIWLLPLGAFGAGTYQLLNYWGLRKHAYRDIVISKFTQMSTQLVLQVGLGVVTSGGFGGLLIADTCGRMSGSLRIARFTVRRDWPFLRKITPRGMWDIARRYCRFPLVVAPSGVINSASWQAPPLLLSAYCGIQVVGLYALTDRFLQIPCALIGRAVSQVYMVQAARLRLTAPRDLRYLFVKTIRRSALCGFVLLAPLCALSPMLFTLFLGQQWREAGYYARVLSPVYYLCFIHYCLDSTLNVLELQHWQVAWDSSRLVAVVLTLVIMGYMHASPIVLLGIFAVVSATAYAMHIALCYRAVCRLQTVCSAATESDVTPRVESMPEPVSR